MKKKLISIIAMCTVLMCIFALQCFASSYIKFDDKDGDISDWSSATITVVDNGLKYTDNYLAVIEIGGNIVGVDNIEGWNRYIEKYCITTKEAFYDETFMNETATDYFPDRNLSSYLYYEYTSYGGVVWDLLQEYWYPDQTAINEYKASEEYQTALQEERQEGYAEGHSAGYSEGYEQATEDCGMSGSSGGTVDSSRYEGDDVSYGTDGMTGCDVCGSGGVSCEHYRSGYDEGFYDALDSEDVQNWLQDAFEQGFNYASSSTYVQEITSAKTEGVDEYKSSQEYRDSLQNAVNEYASSEEHATLLNNTYNNGYTNGRSDYIASEENQANINESYELGYETGVLDGTAAGSNEAYALGVAQGYADFRSSAEYAGTLATRYSLGYSEGESDGYTEGYTNGYYDGYEYAEGTLTEDTQATSEDVIGVVFAVGAMFLVVIGALLVSIKINKRARKKR